MAGLRQGQACTSGSRPDKTQHAGLRTIGKTISLLRGKYRFLPANATACKHITDKIRHVGLKSDNSNTGFNPNVYTGLLSLVLFDIKKKTPNHFSGSGLLITSAIKYTISGSVSNFGMPEVRSNPLRPPLNLPEY